MLPLNWDAGSVPDQGTKIWHATWSGQKGKRKGYRFSLGCWKVLVIHKVMTAPQCECHLTPLNCTLRNGYNGEFYVVSYIFVFYFLYFLMLYLTTKKVKEK